MAERAREWVYVRTKTAAARFFNVQRRSIDDWLDRGMPGMEATNKLNLTLMVEWWGRHIAAPLYINDFKQEDELTELAKQEKKQKIRRQELDYANQIGALVPAEFVEEFSARMAERIRAAGDLLRRHHGDPAQKILHDALDAIAADLEMMFQSTDK